MGQANEPAGGLDQVELGAIRVKQVAGCIDDLHQEVRRIADRGDPGGDLAQRLFGASTPAHLLARACDRLDQPRVLDRDRRLVSERLAEPDLRGPEGTHLRPADLEDAEQAFFAAERRDDQ